MAGGSHGNGLLQASNHRLKRLRRLLSSRKARFEERAFVVEGPVMVAEALAAAGLVGPTSRPGGSGGSGGTAALRIEGLYHEPGAACGLVRQAEALGVRVHPVAPGVLAGALDTVNPQPVAAIVRRQHPVSLQMLAPAGPVLCLVDVSDPGNVGTLIRSAEAAGAAGVVLAGRSVDPTNPKTVRATAGAALRLTVAVWPDTEQVLAELAATRRPIVATVVGREAVPYDEAPLSDAVIVLGNEAHGLPPDIVGQAEVVTTIPLAGPTESLNLAAAGAVLCFEALRQRRRRNSPPCPAQER